MGHPVKAGIDIIAAMAILGTFVEHFPVIAAGVGGIWYAIQIGEWAYSRFFKSSKA